MCVSICSAGTNAAEVLRIKEIGNRLAEKERDREGGEGDPGDDDEGTML